MDRSFDVHIIKRYKNLLETSVNATERRTIKKMLLQEEAKQALHVAAPKQRLAVSVLTPALAGSGETMTINDNLPTSSPSGKSTLIGLACALGFVVAAVLYYQTIGF